MPWARSSVRRSTWRGSPSYGSRAGVTTSQNMRATPLSSGRQGRIANVDGSGIAIMSDSSIALKPVIDEPSKPMPPSKASSSSWALNEKLFSWPRMSVNQRRTKRMSRSSTKALTSSAVCGWSAMGRSFGRSAERSRLQPGARPALQRQDSGLERLALLGQGVFHPHRGVVDHAPLDDPLGRQLLHALRQKSVRQVGHELLELRETRGALHQNEQDRARPALADQLDGLVVGRAAGLPPHGHYSPLGGHDGHRSPSHGAARL